MTHPDPTPDTPLQGASPTVRGPVPAEGTVPAERNERAPFSAELALTGRPVIVVGGGPAALPRIASLLASGAVVTVVSAEVLPAVHDLIERKLVVSLPRDLHPDDLPGSWLVVAATGDGDADRRTRSLADAAHVLCIAGAELRATADDGWAGGVTAENRANPPESAAPVPDRAPTEGTIMGEAARPAHQRGRVILVGGGPGDPGLLTVAGRRAVRMADVIVTDRLAPLAVLAEAPPDTEVIDVSKIPGGLSTPQEEINRLLVTHAAAGKLVVRLKGGDSFVFGRGGEEVEACAAAGVEVQVIPGVTSAVAAPELAGIPVTHRGLNQGFTVISGHVPPDDPRSTIDYRALARTGTDLVLLMAIATLPKITEALLAAGMPTTTPAATIADAGLSGQLVIRATVGTIAAAIAEAGVRSPAVTVIGAVAGFRAGTQPSGR